MGRPSPPALTGRLATCSWSAVVEGTPIRGFFVVFSWLFRGPLLSRNGFFVAFSWPPFWANFTRTRPGTVF